MFTKALIKCKRFNSLRCKDRVSILSDAADDKCSITSQQMSNDNCNDVLNWRPLKIQAETKKVGTICEH